MHEEEGTIYQIWNQDGWGISIFDGYAIIALIGKELKVVFDDEVPIVDAYGIDIPFGDSLRIFISTLES